MRGRLKEKREAANKLEYEKAKMMEELRENREKFTGFIDKLQGFVSVIDTDIFEKTMNNGVVDKQMEEKENGTGKTENLQKRGKRRVEKNVVPSCEEPAKKENAAKYSQCIRDIKTEIQTFINGYKGLSLI